MLLAEDAGFAKRLKEWGKKKCKNMAQSKMGWSCRAEDSINMGIGYYLNDQILAYLKGNDRKSADEAYYEDQGR